MMDGAHPASFGVLLRGHRLAAGLAQTALAERAALSTRGLAFLERGARRPYPDTVRRLADALGLAGEERATFMAASLAGLSAPARENRYVAPPTPVSGDATARATNLPVALTSLVGRAQEREAARALLGSARLVTLTGTGGIGKTRLALAVAADLVDRFAAGVWLVDLAAVTEAALVPAAVARVLGAGEQAHQALLATLTERLKERRLLLVLDNCEHLVVPCAELVETLLRGCPEVHVLATSREMLRVPGERILRVSALPLPGPIATADPQTLSAYGAVELFCQRARDRLVEFDLNTRNMGSVVAICARLDGIPLAIELAAARVGVLSVADIAARLDARFALLTEGPRNALSRQQTLQASLDWSWALLSVPEQVLLCRLAVFANGWSLAAAEAVCQDADLPARSVLDVLGALVAKSLVQVVEHPEERRYTFLETVHQYAGDQLRAAGEEIAWRDRQLRWSVELAETAEPELTGGAQETWFTRLETEHGNLRAALAWAGAQGRTTMGLRLAGALWRFWYTRGSVGEGLAWCERLSARESGDASDDNRRWRAKALVGAAGLAYRLGSFPRAVQLADESRAIYHELSDLRGRANALTVLAVIAREEGNLQQARDMQEDILVIRRELHDRHGTAAALHNLAQIYDSMGDYPRAGGLFEKSLEISRAEGSSAVVANTLNSLGMNAWMQGNVDVAERMCSESLALARRVGAKSVISYALVGLGTVALTRGRYDEARQAYEDSLVLRQEVGDKPGVAGAYTNLAHVARRQGRYAEAGALYRASLALQAGDRVELHDTAECLHGLAEVWYAQGQPVRAAWLLGVVAGIFAAGSGAVPAPENRVEFERITDLVRSALNVGRFDEAWAAGQSLPLQEAIAKSRDADPGLRPQ